MQVNAIKIKVQIFLFFLFKGKKFITLKMMGKFKAVGAITDEDQKALEDINENLPKTEYSRGWVKDGLYIATRKYASNKLHCDSCIHFNRTGESCYGLVDRMFCNSEGKPIILVKCVSLNVDQVQLYDEFVTCNLLDFMKTGYITNYTEALHVDHIKEKMFCKITGRDCHMISLGTFAEIQ